MISRHLKVAYSQRTSWSPIKRTSHREVYRPTRMVNGLSKTIRVCYFSPPMRAGRCQQCISFHQSCMRRLGKAISRSEEVVTIVSGPFCWPQTSHHWCIAIMTLGQRRNSSPTADMHIRSAGMEECARVQDTELLMASSDGIL